MFRAACAIRAFEIAGTNAACAVPGLAAMITDDNPPVTIDSIYVLTLIGPPAAPAIRRAMSSRIPYVRAAAIGSLKRFGTNAAEAIPDVVTALSDYDINVRQSATNLLETLYPDLLTNTPAQ
jgi:HEAT repeat protein